MAHKRVTPSVGIVVPSRMRSAAMMAEIDRIGHRLRPRVGSEPCEDFLNSRAIVVSGQPPLQDQKTPFCFFCFLPPVIFCTPNCVCFLFDTFLIPPIFTKWFTFFYIAILNQIQLNLLY